VRDALPKLRDLGVAVLGVSPDTPDQQKRFDVKLNLGYPLLCDTENTIASDYGVWGEQQMYGKKYMGIIRSSFLIDENGKLTNCWYKITPKDTVPELLKALKS
jgi:thioredoxin-dependent peroxiredoxin